MGFFIKFSRSNKEHFHIIIDPVNIHSRVLKKIINFLIQIKGGYVSCVENLAHGTF